MSIISNAKEIADLIQKLGDVELYRKIVELEGEIIELTREKRVLEEKLEKITAQSEVVSKLQLQSSFYFLPGDKEPYCPRCVEVDRRAVHIHKTTTVHGGRRLWRCPQCKTDYANWNE